MPLVLVRTPTYRRPHLLTRALLCLQAQTHQDWVCEVRDDCPEASARDVVESFGDPRIHYVQNRPQKFMVRNLDDCYLRENPYRADHFYMLEDDNQIRPEFMSTGVDICRQMGVAICQMNQVVEHNSGLDVPHIGDDGVLDDIFDERVYAPDEFRLAMFGAIGISNGAVFWSRTIREEMAVRVTTLPTLEEYLRTALVSEPVYVSREKLAVWAENEQATSRNLGLDKSWLRRELDLKASITALQRAVWTHTDPRLRAAFLQGEVLRIPLERRLTALRKAGIAHAAARHPFDAKGTLKRLAVRTVGRAHASVGATLDRMRAAPDLGPRSGPITRPTSP